MRKLQMRFKNQDDWHERSEIRDELRVLDAKEDEKWEDGNGQGGDQDQPLK